MINNFAFLYIIIKFVFFYTIEARMLIIYLNNNNSKEKFRFSIDNCGDPQDLFECILYLYVLNY